MAAELAEEVSLESLLSKSYGVVMIQAYRTIAYSLIIIYRTMDQVSNLKDVL